MTPTPLLVVAGALYGILGLAFTFAPAELLAVLGVPASPVATWLGQVLGAALAALAFLDWFLRFTQMGGIHGRPLLVTNLSFLSITCFASVKQWQVHGGGAFAGATVVSGLLAAAFARRLFSRVPQPDAPR